MPSHSFKLIASAVARRHGELLLVQQRYPGDPRPYWGLPGGLVEPGEELLAGLGQEVLEETDYQYRCWDNLYMAEGGEGDDEDARRESLRRLHDLLGDEAYYEGRMPPAAPFWRFAWVD